MYNIINDYENCMVVETGENNKCLKQVEEEGNQIERRPKPDCSSWFHHM